MIKWFKIYKNQYLGVFFLGIAFFVLQELPYIVMPLIHLSSNPIMNMGESSIFLNIIEKVVGSLSVAFLILIVNKNEKWFSLSNRKERLFFILALVMLAINFGGWIAYYNGYQTYALMLICLVGAVPLYYMFLGLWRKNYPLVIISILFLIVHVTHVALNLSL
ncbi:MAG: hypothetical protein WC201_01650 [Bacilli bacterium]